MLTDFVVMTGVQLSKALDEMTTFSALKYSGAARGVVELNGMLNLGGLQGACRRGENVNINQLISVISTSAPHLGYDTHHVIECCCFCDSIFSQHRDVKNSKFAEKKYFYFSFSLVT